RSGRGRVLRGGEPGHPAAYGSEVDSQSALSALRGHSVAGRLCASPLASSPTPDSSRFSCRGLSAGSSERPELILSLRASLLEQGQVEGRAATSGPRRTRRVSWHG